MKFLTRLRFDDRGMRDLSGTSWENTGVTFDAPGRFGGKAARFNGASYLKTSNDEFNFGIDIDFTISLWMKFSNARNYVNQVLIGSYLELPSSYQYCVLYSSLFSNGMTNFTVSDVQIASSDVAYDDGTWHHVALTRAVNTVRLFMDGKIKSTYTSDVLLNFCIGGTSRIGWMNAREGSSFYYVGELDDICVIKDRALWTANFVPPSTYLDQPSLLYRETDGKIYGMKAVT